MRDRSRFFGQMVMRDSTDHAKVGLMQYCLTRSANSFYRGCLIFCWCTLTFFVAIYAKPMVTDLATIERTTHQVGLITYSSIPAAPLAQSGGEVNSILRNRVSILVQCLIAAAILPFSLPVFMAYPIFANLVEVGDVDADRDTTVFSMEEISKILACKPNVRILPLFAGTEQSDSLDIVLPENIGGGRVRVPITDSIRTELGVYGPDDTLVVSVEQFLAWLIWTSPEMAHAALLDSVKQRSDDPILWCRLSIVANLIGKPIDIVQSYMEKALKYRSRSNPNQFNYMMALSFASFGKCEEALDYCGRVLKGQPNYHDAMLLKAVIEIEQNKPDGTCR